MRWLAATILPVTLSCSPPAAAVGDQSELSGEELAARFRAAPERAFSVAAEVARRFGSGAAAGESAARRGP